MSRKFVSGIVLVVLLVGMSTFAFDIQPVRSEPKTWIVDDDGPADFSTIQEAIDAASPGDKIFVYNGTYAERVFINKSITLLGEDPETTSITGYDVVMNTTVSVTADNVTINGFKISAPDFPGLFPTIEVYGSYFTFTNNIINDTYTGIWTHGDHHTITENMIHPATRSIWCEGIDFNISHNSIFAYYLLSIVPDGEGIVSNNYIIGDGTAFNLSPSSNCTITENTVECEYVLDYENSFDARVYHNNFINNNSRFRIWDPEDTSNITLDNGYPSGGNYWGNHSGVDIKRGSDQLSDGSDGIVDTPFVINENNIDHYPLTKPYTGPHDIGAKVHISRTAIPEGYRTATNISVAITNYGIQTEHVNVTCQTTTSYEQLYTITSRNTTTMIFTWNTTGLPKGNYTITVSAEPIPNETDTTDNHYTSWVIVSMMGDITGPDGWPDGECNMMDVATVARYFGQTSPPAPGNYDVIYDGAIDMVDVSTVARHFGETDP